jgi:hypothetical protein
MFFYANAFFFAPKVLHLKAQGCAAPWGRA